MGLQGWLPAAMAARARHAVAGVAARQTAAVRYVADAVSRQAVLTGTGCQGAGGHSAGQPVVGLRGGHAVPAGSHAVAGQAVLAWLPQLRSARSADRNAISQRAAAPRPIV